MNDSGDYSVRKSGSNPEVWGVGQVSDDGVDARARKRAKRSAQRRKKKTSESVESDAPDTETSDQPEKTEGDHTVDHLA